MVFFNKTKNVPDELPELAINELKKDSAPKNISVSAIPPIEKISQQSSQPALTQQESEKKISLPISLDPPKQQELPESNSIEARKSRIDSEKSYFNEIFNGIAEEITDLGSLEKWYEKKFVSEDVVNQMKGYWENQKNDIVLKSLGQNFKDRINESAKKLQKLEGEWQNIYFDLAEKEEEMKAQEKQLRKIISEFIELGKRKTSLNEDSLKKE